MNDFEMMQLAQLHQMQEDARNMRRQQELDMRADMQMQHAHRLYDRKARNLREFECEDDEAMYYDEY